MSDSASEFRRKTLAMFELAETQLVNIAMSFVVRFAWPLIDTTPGPNLQYPEDTEYIATGRLRAAWSLSLQPLGSVSRYDGGPYTEHGEDTLAAIEAAAAAWRGGGLRGLPRNLYLVNDVAYGYIVEHELGRHSPGRPGNPWVDNAALRWPARAMREALTEVMGQ